MNRFRKYGKFITLSLVAVFIMFTIPSAEATSIPLDPLGGGGFGTLSDTGLGTTDPVKTSAQLINVLLRVLGLFTLLLMLYGGFRWMWARGNQEDITAAKEIVIGTFIGLIIILASFGILQWSFFYLVKITNGT